MYCSPGMWFVWNTPPQRSDRQKSLMLSRISAKHCLSQHFAKQRTNCISCYRSSKKLSPPQIILCSVILSLSRVIIAAINIKQHSKLALPFKTRSKRRLPTLPWRLSYPFLSLPKWGFGASKSWHTNWERHIYKGKVWATGTLGCQNHLSSTLSLL